MIKEQLYKTEESRQHELEFMRVALTCLLCNESDAKQIRELENLIRLIKEWQSRTGVDNYETWNI